MLGYDICVNCCYEENNINAVQLVKNSHPVKLVCAPRMTECNNSVYSFLPALDVQSIMWPFYKFGYYRLVREI